VADTHPGDGASSGERLKRYWQHGAGAMKILWGVPGDFDRCVHHIGKHVDPEEAKRICAQWHHDVLGKWPGQEHGK
jgi:uncharacterized short protein YbdD (DUF466 family)